VSKKRKRNGKNPASGAGSLIPDHELGTGISRKMQRIIHEEVDEIEDVPFSSKRQDDMDFDSDGDDSGEALRQPECPTSGQTFKTFKYRPILGIVVIGEGGGDNGPEVALVERPIWETDLEDRYVGDQEWVKSGL
jgi:U3 small nucleolar RNA-associated protein 4